MTDWIVSDLVSAAWRDLADRPAADRRMFLKAAMPTLIDDAAFLKAIAAQVDAQSAPEAVRRRAAVQTAEKATTVEVPGFAPDALKRGPGGHVDLIVKTAELAQARERATSLGGAAMIAKVDLEQSERRLAQAPAADRARLRAMVEGKRESVAAAQKLADAAGETLAKLRSAP